MSNIFLPNATTYLKAKELFTQNEVVAFPTETIYGLGANALSDIAAEKIFQLKGRPNDNPLIVHLGAKQQIADYAYIENEIQQTIIDNLMPWPITLLLPKKDNISPIVCKVPLVGIRLPSNEITQKMLTTVALPIAAPSANLSGKASPTNAQMVYDNLGDNVPMIIDGGESEAGIESTVVRVDSGNIRILRPGFITKEDLDQLFNHEIPVAYTTTNPELSPGMRYKHYSIRGEVRIINEPPPITPPIFGKKIGYLITIEFWWRHKTYFNALSEREKWFIKIWGNHLNLASCANNLFAMYHRFDQQDVEILYVERLPEMGIGYSIMNRVKRSAEVHSQGSIASA